MTLQEQVQLLLVQLQSAEGVLTRHRAPMDLLIQLRSAISVLQADLETHTVTSASLATAIDVRHLVLAWATTPPLYPLVRSSIHHIVHLRHRLFAALDQVVSIVAAPLELCVAIGCTIQEATGLLAREAATTVELVLWLSEAGDVLSRVASYASDTAVQEVA